MLDTLQNEGSEPSVEIRCLGPASVQRPGSGNGWRRLVRSRSNWLAACVAVATVFLLAVAPGQVRQWHKSRCVQQLKQLGVALYNFQEAHGHYPAAAITDEDGKPLLSWRVAILPQLGHSSLYAEFRLNEPWDSPHNLALVSRMPPIYACPSLADRRAFVTGYQVVVGPRPKLAEPGSLAEPGTLFEWSRGVEIREVIDGPSSTLMVAETNWAIPWTQPDDLRFNPDGPLPPFGSGHDGGFHVILADASTRFLKSTIDPMMLRALLTRDGSEILAAG